MIQRNMIGAALLAAGVVIFCLDACKSENITEKQDYNKARTVMVERQIAARGISDQRVLQALLKVPRHLFVPRDTRPNAYIDHPLPIGENQTISQPYIVALMSELISLKGNEKVLEIGTGSGYQAAVLGELAREVYTIEIVEPLAERSRKLLDSLGYENVTVRCGDGFIGWEEHAPFDAIIVTCAPPQIPQPLLEQLADSGRMVVPVGTLWQELILIEKADGLLSEKSIIPVRFVPMTGEGVRDTMNHD
ncbi:MAG: protein-L-isoaspartate(D-aspartate) O-methyltransferase [candidate division Zixibacteria bacterium]|nr:protein-L-isoaspartate(D-aspartate) O-methyltransferase [candidate division Zixibacteria bacterium]